MLTVWAGLWGNAYPEIYLHRLRAGVARHLAAEYAFRVIADRHHVGYHAVWPVCGWPKWWPKLWLFAIDRPGINVWIDLDSVIIGSLDELIERHAGDRLAMPANWAQSGHGGCQSSVMIWQGGACRDLFDAFVPARDMGRLWGDQEWITERYGEPGKGNVTPIAHPAVVSYKYHCREGGPPADARICTFHGEPKPAQVQDAWVRQAWL